MIFDVTIIDTYMETIKKLSKLGFNNKQATIYIAVLELGNATVLEISRKAHIKRSTTYVILDELYERGLIKQIKKGSTTEFIALEPSILEEHINEQSAVLNSIKPYLHNLFLQKKNTPVVTFYSGINEVEKVYQRIFKENRKIDFFGTDLEVVHTKFPDMFDIYTNRFKTGEYQIREILTFNPFNINYARTRYHHFNKIRIIDNKYSFFGDNALYGNTLLIIGLDMPFAVTIESKDVIKTFNSLYDITWGIARHPRNIPQSEIDNYILKTTNNVPHGTNEIQQF